MDSNDITQQDGEYTFTALSAVHLDAVLELEYLTFSTPWSKEQYTALMQAGICRLFGVLRNGGLAAYMAVSMLEKTGELEIYNIAVSPQMRRLGLALKLLRLVLSAGARLGLERAVLEVRAGNVPAISLYERAGFTRCGLRRRYYTNPDEDALLYEYTFVK